MEFVFKILISVIITCLLNVLMYYLMHAPAQMANRTDLKSISNSHEENNEVIRTETKEFVKSTKNITCWKKNQQVQDEPESSIKKCENEGITSQERTAESESKERHKNGGFFKNDNDFTNPDKWIILLSVNNGFYDIFENWWRHFRKLNLKVNVTIIAEDDIVYDKLKANYSKTLLVVIVRSWILNMTSAFYFNTRGYKKMVSTRPVYIVKYLEKSTNILYADIDTVFLKNPFEYFKGDFDMWVQSEKNATVACSGFMAIKSNKKTNDAMRLWNSKLSKINQRNQPALNDVLRTSDLKIKYLKENKFVGGPTFSRMSTKQRSDVVMLHATYCLGHDEKYNCYRKWKLWVFN